MFRAYDSERERLVAVKLFRLDLVPERVHQLAAELDVLIEAGLSHPVISAPLAAGITGVSAYLGQEFVAADSLDLVLRDEGPLQPDQALRLAAKLGAALDTAAAAGILHGALHPRDVLISAEATRLTGLGVAQALERVGAAVPLRRPYTAPERTGSAAWDARADVFSLAMLLHELIWGRRLAGTGEQAAGAIVAIEGGDLVRLQGVFARALAEDPRDRFETAGAFVEALTGAFALPEPPPRPARRRREVATWIDTPQDVPLPLEESPAAHARAGIVETDDLTLAMVDEQAREPVAFEEVPLVRADDESYHEVDAPVVPEPEPALAAAAHGSAAYQQIDAQDIAASEDPDPGARLYFADDGEDSHRTSLRPLALALILGIAIGFAAGFPLGFRIQPAAVQDARAAAEPPQAPAPAASVPAAPVEAPPPARMPAAPLLSMAPAEPVAPVVAPPAPAPVVKPVDVPSGSLSVRSTPSGARVQVDGRDVGRTPLTTKNLSHGTYQVRVARDGYTAVEKRVSVTAAKPSQAVTVALSRTPPPAQAKATRPQPASRGNAPGSLGVESRPVGANVFVDGKLVGTTPLLLASVTPGAHAVRLEIDGYREWIASVNVVAGERHRVAASLER